MKDNENKRVSILVEDDDPNNQKEAPKDGAQNKAEKLKKPIIFVLMAVVFLGCMYLIFKPSSDKKKVQDIGLNDAVPQATDAGLQSDKQKAYEQEMLEQKEQEKRNALTSLSDYWNEDSTTNKKAVSPDEGNEDGSAFGGGTQRNGNPALNSYRNAQSTLGSFYDNNDYQTQELRRQVDELKEKLAAKDVPATTTVQDQMALMEKSYQMAAKYLPSNTTSQPGKIDTTVPAKGATQKEHFVAFSPARKNAVSALYREPTDSAFLASWNETRNRGFYTAGTNEQVVQPKNSIKAVVQETQTVTDESGVRLRLMETAKTPSRTIPAGTVLTANAKFAGGRLQLKITSIEFEGNIIPVEITVYDLDGQQGLYVPYSPEVNALTEIASNMSQTSGTSIMMTRSAGQQAAGDLFRGVVQGISGYFAKKVRTPKVTVKAGHQLFLVSKN
ncbi:Bacteroides conjugative transposon TraM protein [Chitinophaga terrae (ex Kim and Jung 2007)]|uniref:Bacteroides conjugative transposon TraM protein n=1 Tax=Chitinophaga terrae (ex Kim and Jung 2007) TaxID=408074 RepID=A0A1H4EYU0_9BACT|nr:conjugative transposon protein TraM [Chitinophaga terrae (ex Kim and Jung 2007)]GEP90702.1 conjugative transposon protein TraM [Chitinophaga terrae (ex Kim and Jung 2007)]SEA89820.1 Bacteroides conjugative transposon TraM protein [Chitinophaga terrae (ex Kim and Jung 2007)]